MDLIHSSTRTLVIPVLEQESPPFSISAAAGQAQLVTVGTSESRELSTGDVILEINARPVSGMTVGDVMQWIRECIAERRLLQLLVLPKESVETRDLAEILARRQHRSDGLQKAIRDNVYSRTVPYTTRPPRAGEIDSLHYHFVNEAQFNQLRVSGKLLESGEYQGHFYGTPKPDDDNEATMVKDVGGPLPPNWEIAYSPAGEKYFIDHNSGTTQWQDPRELPEGWERVEDAVYGVFYVELLADTVYFSHVNKKTQYERPMPAASATPSNNAAFTRDPSRLRGELFDARLVKGPRGFGFTLIGNDSSSPTDEFLQVKSVIPNGPAAVDGRLQTGDVLVFVDERCVLGTSQEEAMRIFQGIAVGQAVTLRLCRGYPLILDPENQVVTEDAYGRLARDMLALEITKGDEGFGFTIADSPGGQRVKKILFPERCPNLLEGDVLLQLNNQDLRSMTHGELVDLLRDCAIGQRARLVVRRHARQRSKTPTPGFRYGEPRATAPPNVQPRSKTPAPQPPRPHQTYKLTTTNGFLPSNNTRNTIPRDVDIYENIARIRPSSSSFGFATPNYVPASAFLDEADTAYGHHMITVNLIRKPNGFGFRVVGGTEEGTCIVVGQIVPGGAADIDGRLKQGDEIVEIDGQNVLAASHASAVALMQKAANNGHCKLVVRRLMQDIPRSMSMPVEGSLLNGVSKAYDVVLSRTPSEGFGFVIISSVNRNGSTIGRIMPDSPASRNGHLRVGDRVIAVNDVDILHLSHGEIVNLIKDSGLSVQLTIAPPAVAYSNLPPVDSSLHASSSLSPVPVGQGDQQLISVVLQRGSKGFGFSIRGGQEFGAMPLFVLRIADDGPAAIDGRLRVGDQVVRINGASTQGLSHEQAIQLIKQQSTVSLLVHRQPMM